MPSDALGGGAQGVDETDSSGAPTSLLRAAGVVWALRVTALVAVLAVGAAQYLARLGAVGQVPAAAQAGQHARADFDPETTGSIGAAARGVRFDPCTALRR